MEGKQLAQLNRRQSLQTRSFADKINFVGSVQSHVFLPYLEEAVGIFRKMKHTELLCQSCIYSCARARAHTANIPCFTEKE